MERVCVEVCEIGAECLRVDGVVFLRGVQRVRLGSFDHLLCVVQQEHAEEDQTSINGHRVQTCPERRGGRQEHGAWDNGIMGNV